MGIQGTLLAQSDSIPVPREPTPNQLLRTRNTLILPLVARSIETDWSIGVASSFTFRFGHTDTLTTRTSNTQALALYSLRKQFIAAINGTTYFPGERIILNYQLSYSYFPDKFWGLGKEAPDENEESYTFKQYYAYLHFQRKVKERVFAGLVYEYQRLLSVDYQPGKLFDQLAVPGRNPYHISGAGLSLTYDSRNNAFAPDQGGFLQVYFNHFARLFGSDFGYTNYVIDFRRFLRIYRQQVLAIQAYGFFNSGNVPLRSLASFGGSNSMRGFYDGRFRSKNQIVAQVEYRVPLFWRLGAVGFFGVGNVGDHFNDLNFQEVKYSAGGGVRLALNRKERLNLRIDYGWGLGQSLSNGLYFQLGEAF
ncbi:BamA/TamA family outer membrane protein [Spirosoma foliorum]|uniref:BamA/TamA family outer membrane protein n=1 Tax=Spirosoma foliorum TaxID=2710596 RepID=A0A7G5H471_9BACT|nr:BamA/TamA family outer membrane protein [Spirosoma foliorum]QMW05913.1 BamA/TamA family outer membrane protein [Spirosoma foliorum]